MVRIALDTVRSGSPDPDVVRGAIHALVADEHLEVTFVGPEDAVHAAFSEAGHDVPASGRASVTDAARAVSADDDPVVAVRARQDASIRVAVDLLSRGEVDAVVSVGPAAATVAAARFALGRVPGLRQPVLAVALSLPAGRLIVADAGVSAESTTAGLVRTAELAADVARRRGVASPRVGLHVPAGMRSRATDATAEAIAASDLVGTFVGSVDTTAALTGGVDVLVTTGALGEAVTSASRTFLSDAGGHLALLLGTTAHVATLDATRPEDVAVALAELTDHLRARELAGTEHL